MRLIDELTPEEEAKLKEIDERFSPIFAEINQKWQKAFDNMTKAHSKATKEKRPLTIEEAALDDELREIGEQQSQVNQEWLDARAEITKNAEQRVVSLFTQTTEDALSLIKSEVPRHIAMYAIFAGKEPTKAEREREKRQQEKHKREIEQGIAHNLKELETRPDDEQLIKDTEGLKELLSSGAYMVQSIYDMHFSDKSLRENIESAFSQYLSFLEKAAPEAYKEACIYIDDCIKNKRVILQQQEEKVIKESGKKPTIDNIVTRSPKSWVTPVDKVSNLAFDGEGKLYNSKLVGVDISSRKTKKEILSMVSLNFDDKAIQITGKRELTPYDREVHDAIVTLFVDGGNELITPQMIYRAMTGNPEAKLTPKQQEAISNSVNKLMYSRLVIRASKEECEAYGFKKFSYEGTVIQAEKVTATFKGSEVAEVVHLLKEPVLYTYADKKDQIGRLDIKLLNSPVNKTEENITLQSYLYRRILAIKSSGKISPTIIYDTVYKQIELEAASDGALRKKKLKVRNTIKQILDYWKKQGFIKDYIENTRKTEIVSVTVRW